jgi:biopolymer transport protein ExbD
MRIRRGKWKSMENSSATSDLAFLLIIYFIVIAGFNVNRGFLMDLPKKDSVRTVKSSELLRFSIDSGGVLFFQGKTISRNGAEAEIRSVVAVRPNTALILTVAGGAPWQSVVSFVDLARKLAVESFSFSLENGVSQ